MEAKIGKHSTRSNLGGLIKKFNFSTFYPSGIEPEGPTLLNLPDRTVWQSTTNRKFFIKFRNIKFWNLMKKHHMTNDTDNLEKFLVVCSILQGVSGEIYLFYFNITFFWKMILNFRLLENNELICPFYAYFFVFENLDFGHWNENLLFFPEGISKKFLRQLIQRLQKR